MPNTAGENLDPNPYTQFKKWFDLASSRPDIPMPDAMGLATASKKGRPSVRMVLYKGFDDRGFLIYTNYRSPKARDLISNPLAEIVFHWGALQRQIRIFGKAKKLTQRESEAYFATRPRESQIGAWASPQSTEIPDYRWLETEFEKLRKRFEGREVPCPPHWGGFRLIPERFEFWEARAGRLHDRRAYLKKGKGWKIVTLAP